MARYTATIVLAATFATLIELPLSADEVPARALTGSLVFDGQPYPEPTIARLPIGEVRNESLLVNPENGGVANVVVSLIPTSKDTKVVARGPKDVVIRGTDTGFSPHVVVLQVGDTLRVNNSGTFGHTVNVQSVSNAPIDALLSPGEEFAFTPSRPERSPVSLTCRIKSWMFAWIVISDAPHVAVSDENGEFQFPNVTPGEYDVKIWHERIGAVKNADLGNTMFTRTAEGYRVQLENASGDLGRIALTARLFDPK